MFDQLANLKQAVSKREAKHEQFERILKRATWAPEMLRLIERKQENERALCDLYGELRRYEPNLPRGRYEPEPRDQTKKAPVSGRKRQPKGFEGLGKKRNDMSKYTDLAKLTDMQQDCFSLKFEHDLRVTEIARRLGKHHSTVQYHIIKAKEKIDQGRGNQGRAARRAITGAELE